MEHSADADPDFSLGDAVAGDLRAAQAQADESETLGEPASPPGKVRIAPHFFQRLFSISKIAAGSADRASFIAAVVGGAGYFALACLSLWLSLGDGDVTPVWLPNAFAVALLLRIRLGNEPLFLLACFAASLAANGALDLPGRTALLFSVANVVEIVVVLALTRTAARAEVEMDRLSDLARFVWAGGLVGPLVSAIITAAIMGANFEQVRAEVVAWFLTDSLAMVLIVPTTLLLVDRVRGKLQPPPASTAERVATLIGGTTTAFIVFGQSNYPLMFLIQPIILLHAFRVGSLGSALQVSVQRADCRRDGGRDRSAAPVPSVRRCQFPHRASRCCDPRRTRPDSDAARGEQARNRSSRAEHQRRNPAL